MYKLSKVIPVRFHSTYLFNGRKTTSTWWQWRGHVFNHKAASA